MEKSSKIRGLRKIAGSARVRIGAPAIGLFAWVGYMSDGYAYWGWFSENWRWVLDWVRHPAFYWAVFVILLLIVGLGVRRVVASEERDSARRSENEEATRKAYDDRRETDLLEFRRLLDRATKLPNAMAALKLLEDRVEQLAKHLDSDARTAVFVYGRTVSAAEVAINSPDQRQRTGLWGKPRQMDDLWLAMAKAVEAINKARRLVGQVGDWNPQSEVPELRPGAVDVAVFGPWLEAHRAARDECAVELERLRSLGNAQTFDVRAMREAVLREILQNAQP